MRLYTIQHPLAKESLNNLKNWHCEKKFSEPEFADAYQWLEMEMLKKGITPKNIKYSPIWAWAQYDGENKKRPDLRCTGYLPKGTKGVLIEIEKKKSDILLSDFSLWHYVLNKSYLPDSMETDKEKSTSIDKINSWSKIFDLSFCPKDISEPYQRKKIQATFWSIRPEEVVKITNFIAR